MPHWVDYSTVLHTTEAAGLRCVYPGGAAFRPTRSPETPLDDVSRVVCWSGTEDLTIKPQWRSRIVQRELSQLASLTVLAVRDVLRADAAWLAPVHHWASELSHGRDEAGESVESLLLHLGLDPEPKRNESRADAIAFNADEFTTLEQTVADLFAKLWKTDFTLLVPGQPTFATLHHHRQVWWTCQSPDLAEQLRNL